MWSSDTGWCCLWQKLRGVVLSDPFADLTKIVRFQNLHLCPTPERDMGFRFRRSVRLIPGVRLNFSVRGVSISLGAPGATLNFSGRGARATFGVPGTGFSWSQSLNSGSPTPSRSSTASSRSTTPINTLDELESTLNNPNSSVVYGSSGRRLSDQQHRLLRTTSSSSPPSTLKFDCSNLRPTGGTG